VVGIRNEIIRERRAAKGACRVCGYDLTGNVSGICPECGLPIDQAQA
jgi:rubrerythrin